MQSTGLTFTRFKSPPLWAPPQVELPADFSPSGYLIHNPDVVAAGYDPVLHYVRYGYKEGRRWRSEDQES